MNPPAILDVWGAKQNKISKTCKIYLTNELTKYPNINPKQLIHSWLDYSHSFNPPPIVAGEAYPRRDDNLTHKDILNIKAELPTNISSVPDALEVYFERHPENLPLWIQYPVYREL